MTTGIDCTASVIDPDRATYRLPTNLEDIVLHTGDTLAEEENGNESDTSESGGGDATVHFRWLALRWSSAGSRLAGIRGGRVLERQASDVEPGSHPRGL